MRAEVPSKSAITAPWTVTVDPNNGEVAPLPWTSEVWVKAAPHVPVKPETWLITCFALTAEATGVVPKGFRHNPAKNTNKNSSLIDLSREGLRLWDVHFKVKLLLLNPPEPASRRPRSLTMGPKVLRQAKMEGDCKQKNTKRVSTGKLHQKDKKYEPGVKNSAMGQRAPKSRLLPNYKYPRTFYITKERELLPAYILHLANAGR